SSLTIYKVVPRQELAGSNTATPASITGTDQAQSPSQVTAAAPATQPAVKPTTSFTVSFKRTSASRIKGWRGDSVSRATSTVVVRLPVITAVDGATGSASRRRAN